MKYRQTLLAFLIPALLFSGCVSVRQVASDAVDGEGGGVSVQVFADDASRKAGVLSPRFVVGELERSADGGWQPIFRSLDPSWTVLDLPPGKYKLSFPAQLDEIGNAVRIEDKGRIFRVKKGRIAELESTLDHTPKALIVTGVMTAMIVAVVLHEWLDDHGLPKPPVPRGLLADVAFTMTLDLAFGSPRGRGPVGRPPVVTSHFPEEGALVAAKRLRLIFVASEPLDAFELPAKSVTVLAEKGGLVDGYVTYDPDRWWVIWESHEDLPRDDVLHATLDPEAIRDMAGLGLSEPVSFSFRTTQ